MMVQNYQKLENISSGKCSSSVNKSSGQSSGPLQTTESEDNMGSTQRLTQTDSDEVQNDLSQEQGKLWGVLQPVITPTKKILKNKGTLISLMKAKKKILRPRY